MGEFSREEVTEAWREFSHEFVEALAMAQP